jgi:predicted metal-dependent hydrolase
LGRWYYVAVQLPLPLLAPSDLGRSEPGRRTVAISGRTYEVEIVRHRRARRYVLRVRADGALRLTVPRGQSISGGLAFVSRQAAWVEREQLRRQHRAVPLADGAQIWYRGQLEVVNIAQGILTCGDNRILIKHGADARQAVDRHLRNRAAVELPARCLQLAAVHGLTVARVSVRNQRSRWGACSTRRVITLNWRLIQMTPSVSDYVILHELMHLRQPNHSRRFWREVESVCSWWRDAERWLKKHGKEIL